MVKHVTPMSVYTTTISDYSDLMSHFTTHLPIPLLRQNACFFLFCFFVFRVDKLLNISSQFSPGNLFFMIFSLSPRTLHLLIWHFDISLAFITFSQSCSHFRSQMTHVHVALGRRLKSIFETKFCLYWNEMLWLI